MDIERCVLGVDFGTDSVRALVVNATDGGEISAGTAPFPRWRDGRFCEPASNRFRQHPRDYIEAMERAVRMALEPLTTDERATVAGIGVDATGSTPCAVDASGVPLALLPEFADDPDAMFLLWKDHTAVDEAAAINDAARRSPTDYTRYVGGVYSSEWFWAKILHVLRVSPKVRAAAFSWVEQSDWIPALLTGVRRAADIRRNRCAAGHKGAWNAGWGGLPPESFWTQVDPLLAGVRDRVAAETATSDRTVGGLSPEWAERFGLAPGIPVAAGIIDAHAGAVGSGIRERTLLRIMGTSTCDIMVVDPAVIGDRTIPGICGQVDGSVVPGLVGLEAGQSGFGDVYDWFRRLLLWPIAHLGGDVADFEKKILPARSDAAAALSPDATLPIALDWLNGRRTPFADQRLTGAVAGLSLGTDAPRLFRSLVEGTAFGARAIMELFLGEGIAIDEVIAVGGIPDRNPFVMQVQSDVMGVPIRVVKSAQPCALGAAVCASVASGIHQTVRDAQERMASPARATYAPDPALRSFYDGRYRSYLALGEAAERRIR